MNRSRVHVEVIYEGDHCIPCVYMARAVEEVVEGFGGQVQWEKVVLKQKDGARRFFQLSQGLGKPAPIPSVFVNGTLCFSHTPSPAQLQAVIREALDSL